MIGPIRIQNFKSIRQLEFDAKRVNLFIGEPNTGKSNLIEALALVSTGIHRQPVFKEIYRYKTIADLFFDQEISKTLTVQAGEFQCSLNFNGRQFVGAVSKKGQGDQPWYLEKDGQSNEQPLPEFGVRYYLFKPSQSFSSSDPGTLNPPYGDNLVAILYSNKTLRQSVGSLFRERGFRLEIRPVQNELLIAKEVQDELYSYHWESVSETLRRIVFYKAALETNKDTVLLLDEPESNTFPFYTKYLAERIALDETNQFFIATHNPYLLGSIVAKAPAKETAVYVARMENFETNVQAVPGDRLSQILDLGSSVFFNLDKLLEK